MAMKIKFRHVFVNGVHKVEIIGFRVMLKGQLPTEYIQSETLPKCYTTMIQGKPFLSIQSGTATKLDRFNNYNVGRIVSLEDRDWIEDAMATAGNRLFEINKKIKNERKYWEGRIEVVRF